MDILTSKEQIVFDEVNRLADQKIRVKQLREAYMKAEGEDNLWRYSEYSSAEIELQEEIVKFAKKIS